MIIKHAEGRDKDLAELNGLLALPGLSLDTRKQIQREIRNIQSGLKGEQEAAYQIDFLLKDRKNCIVIHDLRLEFDGYVAQIDHLILNRMMEIYVCESKRFGEGIAINEHGEFSAFYHGKPYGIPSPIEQNKRHIAVLKKLFDSGKLDMPVRLGMKIKPRLRSLILVANSARIHRPEKKKNIEHLDRIIKNEQLQKRLDKDIDEVGLQDFLSVTKIVSKETLQTFAENLAALHTPSAINWKARFGIPDNPKIPEPPLDLQIDSQPEPQNPTASVPHLFCAACKKSVSQTVAHYCWNNKTRFQGKVYCFHCQKNIPKNQIKSPAK